jgi:hypothetical protein
MTADLTLLYTHDLRGDLDLLPRLHTQLRRLWDVEKISRRVLAVDLGDSCDPAVWPCAITEGRSTLLALDAMGFAAANVEGVLSAASRGKLAQQAAIALVDADHPARWEDITFVTRPDLTPSVNSLALTILLTPAERCALADRVLRLTALPPRAVGLARVDFAPGAEPVLTACEQHLIATSTLPDATIAGVIDFIRDEARHYEGRSGN